MTTPDAALRQLQLDLTSLECGNHRDCAEPSRIESRILKEFAALRQKNKKMRRAIKRTLGVCSDVLSKESQRILREAMK